MENPGITHLLMLRAFIKVHVDKVKLYLVLHDALDPFPCEIETVAQREIAALWWFGATAS